MTRSARDAANAANPNNLPAICASVRLGDCLNALPMVARGTVTANVLALPETARAASVLQAFAVAGGTTGQKVPEVQGVVPAIGEAAPDIRGNIVFAGADAVTEAEVMYVPWQGQILEDLVIVTASVATLNGSRRACQLLEVEVLTGVIPGAKIPDFRGVAPAAGEASLALSGLTVAFNAADVVAGTARVRYIAQLGVGNGVPAPLDNRLNDAQSVF